MVLFLSLGLVGGVGCGDDSGATTPNDMTGDPSTDGDDAAVTVKLDSGVKRDSGVVATSDGGAKDAGATPKDAGIIASLDSGTPKDAAVTTPKDTGTVTPPKDAGPTQSVPDAGDTHCLHRFCFDVVDVYVFNPDAIDCGFTACVGFEGVQ